MSVDAALLRRRLTRHLVDIGAIHDPRWRRTFDQVERHLFVPRFYQWEHGTRRYRAVDGAVSPDEWLPAVYSDRVLVVRLRGGVDDDEPASTSSAPSIMACMLEALEVRDGCTVLEIGTGSGYNAALLSARLGAAQVTSVDIDAELVAAARERLSRAGFAAELVAADGMDGWLPRAPYDRIVATCAVSRVPRAWLRQLGPEGVLVTGLGGSRFEGGIARLRKASDGSASGHLLRVATRFMLAAGDAGPTDPPPIELPACLEDAPDAFLARFLLRLDAARPLSTPWQEEAWCRRWVTLGRPTLDRYGLTVRPDGSQHVWLDSPGSGHSWEA